MSGDLSFFQELKDEIIKISAYSSQIPEMREDIKRAELELASLKATTQAMGERISRVEARLDTPHACTQAPFIRDLKKDQSKREELETSLNNKVGLLGNNVDILNKREKDRSDYRKQLRMAFIGIMATLVLTVGSAIWYLADLSATVDASQDVFERSLKHVEERLDEVNDPTHKGRGL